MNREQAKENLISMGIAEPTEDAITKYLNSVHAETKKANDRANALQADADKAAELQAKLDEISNQNLTDIERANKETEIANNKISELEKQISTMTLKSSLAEQGIVGEQADKLIESLSGGSFDVSVLGQIISDKEKAAAIAKEKEIADKTPNPGGGGSNDDDTKTEAEKAASTIIGNIGSEDTSEIVSSYL